MRSYDGRMNARVAHESSTLERQPQSRADDQDDVRCDAPLGRTALTSLHAWLAHIPGLEVCFPSTPSGHDRSRSASVPQRDR